MALLRDPYWKWTTLVPMLAVLGVFFVTMCDPFEWESVTKEWSARIVYKIYAALYPDNSRDKITVVFLDSKTLKTRGETWPPSQSVHGDVLSAILGYHPAAILVDMFFTEQRKDDNFDWTESVIKENAKLRDQKVPIYFVGDFDDQQGAEPARSEILHLAYTNALTLVSGDADYNSEVTTLIPFETRQYGSLVILPAALAIATAECKMADSQTCERLRSLSESEDRKPLEVVWGLRPAPCRNNAKDYDLTQWNDKLKAICSDLSSSWYGRTLQLLLEDIFIPKHYRTYDPVPVPYHASLSAEQVLDGNMHERLASFLTGKIVIYGARHRSASDRALSPVHGHIDGAFVHAMAIDNLLIFGGQYMHPTSIEGLFNKTMSDYQPTALMLLAAIGVGWNRRRLLVSVSVDPQKKLTDGERETLLKSDKSFLRILRYCLYGAFVILGALEFLYVKISPLNWLGFLFVIEGTHWFERKALSP